MFKKVSEERLGFYLSAFSASPPLNTVKLECQSARFSPSIFSYDRFTRVITHFFTLLEEMQSLGVELYAAIDALDLKSPMGKMMAAMSLGFSEQEVKTTRSRSMRGKKERVLGQGKYNASTKPKYGYEWNDPKTKAKLIVREEEAKYVREILRRRVKTETRERVRKMIRDDMNSQQEQTENLEKDLEDIQQKVNGQEKIKENLIKLVKWAREIKDGIEKEESEENE